MFPETHAGTLTAGDVVALLLVQEAARLLAATSLPCETVARRVGYGSAVGFHLAFKQWHGRTPGEFRRSRR